MTSEAGEGLGEETAEEGWESRQVAEEASCACPDAPAGRGGTT